MTLHKIVFIQTGEISYTPKDPHCPLDSFVGNLNAKIYCLWSSDDWRQVEVNKYEVQEIELPDWLPATEWIYHSIQWKYTWGMAHGVKDAPENIQRYMFSLKGPARLAIWKLYNTKSFRSEFRKSLYNQFIEWIDTPEETRKYDNPFSPRQWECIIDVYTCRDYKRISETIYRSKAA